MWAIISDKVHTIQVRFSKEAVKSLRQYVCHLYKIFTTPYICLTPSHRCQFCRASCSVGPFDLVVRLLVLVPYLLLLIHH